MKTHTQESAQRPFRTVLLVLLVTAAAMTMSACSPYASVDIGVPLKVGPVYVNPSIGVGGYL